MGRARGSDATLQLAYETTYGTPPASGYVALPFVSTSLGATRGLQESDLLGQSRNPFDPVPDVIVNDGDAVVPVDYTLFGHWLKMLLGAPSTTGSAAPYSHIFTSQADVVPSASVQIGHPKVPSYSTNYGLRANTLRIQQQRGGLLNATIGLIGKGETTPGGTTSITPSAILSNYTRLAQASGSVKIDNVVVGSVVDGSFSYSNNLDKIETIREDGEIEDADLGMPSASGQIRVRFADHSLLNKAIGGIPVVVAHKWVAGPYAFEAAFTRVFLPRPKRQIDGPGGVMATFDWQASGQGTPLMTAVLTSPTASFG